MNWRFKYWAVAICATACLSGASQTGGEKATASLPFGVGESLTYDITWSIFQAGQVTASVLNAHEGSADAFEIKTTARSQGFVSLLFDVKDEFDSFIGPEQGCSWRISKDVKEGRRHKQTQIVFDANRSLAILDERDLSKADAPPKHAENAIPECVQDVVSAFYFLRRQPLAVGRQVRVPVNDGAKTYEVTVDVQARERVQTPFGTRDALRVEPKTLDGLLKRKGRMLIWFSDDEQRLPLRIKAIVSVGTITGNLKSVSQQISSTPQAK